MLHVYTFSSLVLHIGWHQRSSKKVVMMERYHLIPSTVYSYKIVHFRGIIN